jgi:hypothetical protein
MEEVVTELIHHLVQGLQLMVAVVVEVEPQQDKLKVLREVQAEQVVINLLEMLELETLEVTLHQKVITQE